MRRVDRDERDTGKGKNEADRDAWAAVTDPVTAEAGEPPRPDTGADEHTADRHGPDEHGPHGDPGPRPDPWARLGEEARRLAESLTGADRGDKPAGGPDAPAARLAEEARRLAESLVDQAGAVREQVARRHPEVAAHLAAAGAELANAYRAFVGDRERRWAARPTGTERIDLDE